MSTKTKTAKTKAKKENLAALGLPALWERFKEATGETTKSPNKNYAECTAMRSWWPARRVPPRKRPRATPHIPHALGGGTTLRFPRQEACMATSAGSWRSQGERA